MASQTITHILKHPLDAYAINAVTLRPPVPEDIEALKRRAATGETLVASHLLAVLAGISFETFGMLAGEDLADIIDRAELAWGVSLNETIASLCVAPEGGRMVGYDDSLVVDTSFTFSHSNVGARTHRLVHPFRANGKWIRSVTVRIPVQGDIDDWAEDSSLTFRDMILRLTGLHAMVFRQLAWPDSEIIHLWVQDVLPAFLVAREVNR